MEKLDQIKIDVESYGKVRKKYIVWTISQIIIIKINKDGAN